MPTPSVVEKWEQARIRHSHRHQPIANVNEVHAEKLSRGQRVADGLAKVMGSWAFIITQSIVLAFWIALNVLALLRHWDPYPFILLNLAFSTQAAYAAPLILLAQNRQADRDRGETERDRDINFRTQADAEFVTRELASIRIALADVVTTEDLRDAIDRLHRKLDADDTQPSDT